MTSCLFSSVPLKDAFNSIEVEQNNFLRILYQDQETILLEDTFAQEEAEEQRQHQLALETIRLEEAQAKVKEARRKTMLLAKEEMKKYKREKARLYALAIDKKEKIYLERKKARLRRLFQNIKASRPFISNSKAKYFR
ncbi:MAG: hypothetical protein Q9M36_01785 [Sulfurovum sp.]|nr:hypothetical protein [Sulfurovum sp.]